MKLYSSLSPAISARAISVRQATWDKIFAAPEQRIFRPDYIARWLRTAMDVADV